MLKFISILLLLHLSDILLCYSSTQKKSLVHGTTATITFTGSYDRMNVKNKSNQSNVRGSHRRILGLNLNNHYSGRGRGIGRSKFFYSSNEFDSI